MELGRLQQWEQSLSTEVEALKKRRADIDADIQQQLKKLELVRQMLALEGGSPDHAGDQPLAASEARATPTGVREATKAILTEIGHPLHINDIHQAFIDRGYPIPGGGTPFNILVHLAKSSGFVRVARGTYALAGSVPEAQVLPEQPRRAKRKKAARTRKPKER
jgi:hypothetical protein